MATTPSNAAKDAAAPPAKDRKVRRKVPPKGDAAAATREKKVSFAASADEAVAFFSKLPDTAFFANGPGAPVQHVYMYGIVDEDTLQQLRVDIDDACRGLEDADGNYQSPRPIVVHINSPGGDVDAGLSMMSVFNESRVPICVCVDGISYSAGTFLSILAPYRVMTPLASSLVHDYATFFFGKGDDLSFYQGEAARFMSFIRDMYLRRTRIGASRLDELMKRDLMLDASTCKDLGVCDRVLTSLGTTADGPPRSPSSLLPTSLVLRKTNLNHVRFTCSELDDYARAAAERLDAMLGATMLKPCVLHADGLSCLTSLTDHVAPLVARVVALNASTDTFGVIDTHIDIVNLLPILACKRRIMYSHANVRVHLLYKKRWAWMLRDAFANTTAMLDQIRAMLRARTKLPAKIVESIDRQRYLFSAEDCLRYGIVDEVVRL